MLQSHQAAGSYPQEVKGLVAYASIHYVQGFSHKFKLASRIALDRVHFNPTAHVEYPHAMANPTKGTSGTDTAPHNDES